MKTKSYDDESKLHNLIDLLLSLNLPANHLSRNATAHFAGLLCTLNLMQFNFVNQRLLLSTPCFHFRFRFVTEPNVLYTSFKGTPLGYILSRGTLRSEFVEEVKYFATASFPCQKSTVEWVLEFCCMSFRFNNYYKCDWTGLVVDSSIHLSPFVSSSLTISSYILCSSQREYPGLYYRTLTRSSSPPPPSWRPTPTRSPRAPVLCHNSLSHPTRKLLRRVRHHQRWAHFSLSIQDTELGSTK